MCEIKSIYIHIDSQVMDLSMPKHMIKVRCVVLLYRSIKWT